MRLVVARRMVALVVALGMVSAGTIPARAEIYRYQDELGNWVFTDRPPPADVAPGGRSPAQEPRIRIERLPEAAGGLPARPAGGTSAVPSPSQSARTPVAGGASAAPASTSAGLQTRPTAGTGVGSAGAIQPSTASVSPPPPPPDPRPDLAQRLRRQFNPVSAVEASSLAVVTVDSELGAGSGFFVSENGLVVTNRHVVRPPPDWAAEELAALAVVKERLDALEQRLSLPRDRYSDPNDYDRGRRVFRERSRAYRQAKRELEMKRNAALLQRAFEIQLKNGERLTAELVEISAAYDLALLRVSGYRTPFVRPLLDARLRQTQRVYAIGSPLGIKDTVTAGTYTGERDGMLVTDARIMPGNSGGPLVNDKGFVIGINTWKATHEPDAKSRGFGVSIPIDIAFEEFPDLRALREDEPPDTAPR